MKLKKSLGLIGGCGLLALAVFGIIRLFPLQWMDSKDRFKLWRAGLHSIESSGGDRGVRWRSAQCTSTHCTCVVLVHGMGDSVLTWKKILTNRDWVQQVDKPLQILAWDLLGHGKTPEPVKNPDGELQLRVQSMAHRLLGASQQAGCGLDTVWVGNSLGGWITTWIGLKRPDQVKSLILLAPAGLSSQRFEAAGASVLSTPSVDSLKAFRKRAYAKPQPEYPDWVWRAAVERVKKSPVSRIREAQTPDDDLDQKLEKLQVPTRVLWGKQDQILPLEKSKGFRSITPSQLTRWEEIESCGHLPQKECPERVTTAIIEAVNEKKKP